MQTDQKWTSPIFDIICHFSPDLVTTAPKPKPRKIPTPQLERLEAIQKLVAELKTYCTAPNRTKQVREELKAGGVLAKNLFRKRKKRK